MTTSPSSCFPPVRRRSFIVGLGTAAASSFAAPEPEKTTDGGFADVSFPGVPARARPVLPPGAGSVDRFRRACVACQLCVKACPNGVLRVSRKGGAFLQPEMGFDRGYCRPECDACGRVCPTGAIRPVAPADKPNVHVGVAAWHMDRCLAAQEEVSCTACERHCPVNAISLVPMDAKNAKSPKVPVVDRERCIGCGACEHLCPARPAPAMVVEGLDRQRVVRRMGDGDVLEEARALFAAGKAAVVLVKHGVIVAMDSGRGVAPLLSLYDNRPKDLDGAWVIDKVIGRAAAAIAVAGGAARVHGALISEEAKAFLAEKGVPCDGDVVVPRILNRKRDGLCPLEASVQSISEPLEMIKALRARIAQLRKGK